MTNPKKTKKSPNKKLSKFCLMAGIFMIIIAIVFIMLPTESKSHVFFVLAMLCVSLSALIAFHRSHVKAIKTAEKYDQILETTPEEVSSCYNAGIAYAITGDRKKAIALFEEFLRRFPNHYARENAHRILRRLKGRFWWIGGSCYVYLEEFYRKQGKIEEAIKEFEKAIETNPDTDWVHYGLGVSLAQAGRVEEAKIHLEKFLTSAWSKDPRMGKASKVLKTINKDGIVDVEKMLSTCDRRLKLFWIVIAVMVFIPLLFLILLDTFF